MEQLSIEEALEKGIAAQRSGEFRKADIYYTAILKVSDNHTETNFNMGLLAIDVGKYEKSLPYFRKVVEADEQKSLYWLIYIRTLIQLKKFDEAREKISVASNLGFNGTDFKDLHTQLDRDMFQTTVDLPNANVDSNILVSKTLGAALKDAKQKLNEGSLLEAKHIYKDILKTYPKNRTAMKAIRDIQARSRQNVKLDNEPPKNQQEILLNLYNQGLFQQAIEMAENLKIKFSNSIMLNNIIGASNKGLGRLELAIAAYEAALSIDPKSGDALYNLGNALKERGELDRALNSYQKSLTYKPNFSHTHYNIGTILQEMGHKENAVQAYKRAIKFQPDFLEAHNNLGCILQEQNKLDEAITAYSNAISIDPDLFDPWYNLGSAYTQKNLQHKAAKAYSKALILKPKNTQTFFRLAKVLKSTTFTSLDTDISTAIEKILDKKTIVRPIEISGAAISLIKCDKKMKNLLTTFEFEKHITSFEQLTSFVNNFPLLCTIMKVTPLPDLELEAFLNAARHYILLNIDHIPTNKTILEFQSALSLQCYTNEYVYNVTDNELNVLDKLINRVEQAIHSGEQPAHSTLLCISSYQALNEFQWINKIKHSDYMKEVFNRQVFEPQEISDLKSKLTILNNVCDGVSEEVQKQYEVHPYPRWVNLGLGLEAYSIEQFIEATRLKIEPPKIANFSKPNVLIAGCGTGQQSIEAGTRIKNSNILAIDLSLSSLAYAQKKTLDFGISNISYMQADILNLHDFKDRFDIIESVGVLHHMREPMEGLRILRDCLKPGGLMKIGLYSESARRVVVEIRKQISQLEFHPTDQNIRQFRAGVIKSEGEKLENLRRWWDFYSLSEVRDLLFHVQEHRFTISDIKRFLREFGLTFCGFESDNILQKFEAIYPDNGSIYDLQKWSIFEGAHEHVFAGMYQFWCQKLE